MISRYVIVPPVGRGPIVVKTDYDDDLDVAIDPDSVPEGTRIFRVDGNWSSAVEESPNLDAVEIPLP